MSNTATQNNIKLSVIKVGEKQASFKLLGTLVLRPTNPEFDRHDFRTQINASCALEALANQLPYAVLNAEKFCSNPSAKNLERLNASLKLLVERANSHLSRS